MIYKYGKRTRQLKIKRKLKNFPSRNDTGENCCALELNEKEVIELLEMQHHAGSTKKATNCGMIIFQSKNLKMYLILTI